MKVLSGILALMVGLCMAGDARANFFGYFSGALEGSACSIPIDNTPSPVLVSSSCSGIEPLIGLGSRSYEGSFAVRADYTGLGTYAEWTQTMTGDFFGTPGTVRAGARIMDSLLISGGSGSGMLRLAIAVSGSATSFGGAISFGELSSHSGQFLTSAGMTYLVEGPGEYMMELPFIFGIPVALDLEFVAGITFLDNNGGSHSGGISDFFHSADFLSFTVFDSSELPVPDATVFSTSGFQYQVGEISVPEPSTLTLFGCSLICLGTLHRRGKARAWTKISFSDCNNKPGQARIPEPDPV